jgi:hypothetical protein
LANYPNIRPGSSSSPGGKRKRCRKLSLGTPSPSGPPETQGGRVSLSESGWDLPRDAAWGAPLRVGSVGGIPPPEVDRSTRAGNTSMEDNPSQAILLPSRGLLCPLGRTTWSLWILLPRSALSPSPTDMSRSRRRRIGRSRRERTIFWPFPWSPHGLGEGQAGSREEVDSSPDSSLAWLQPGGSGKLEAAPHQRRGRTIPWDCHRKVSRFLLTTDGRGSQEGVPRPAHAVVSPEFSEAGVTGSHRRRSLLIFFGCRGILGSPCHPGLF